MKLILFLSIGCNVSMRCFQIALMVSLTRFLVGTSIGVRGAIVRAEEQP